MVYTSPVLQILAEEDVATGARGGGEQDAVPPRETVPILYLPGVLRDIEIIRCGAERLEPSDLRSSLASAQEAATIGGNPIEFI
ncbi:MAG: hypothetical protein WEA28_12320 [Xanthobacteraceae bacterium]